MFVMFMVLVFVMLVVMVFMFPRIFGRFRLMKQRQVNQFRITPLLNNLGHDAQGDLVPAPGLNVQTGWRFQGQHIGVG
jgi:hypothetical protein